MVNFEGTDTRPCKRRPASYAMGGRVARSSASHEAATSSPWHSCAIFSTKTSSSAPTRCEVFQLGYQRCISLVFSVLEGDASIVQSQQHAGVPFAHLVLQAPHSSWLLEVPQPLPVFETNLSRPGCPRPDLPPPASAPGTRIPVASAAWPLCCPRPYFPLMGWENSHSRLIEFPGTGQGTSGESSGRQSAETPSKRKQMIVYDCRGSAINGFSSPSL